MKSIKEKAAEYEIVIEVINEHKSLVDTQGSEMFEAGANYVLDAIQSCIDRHEDGCLALEAIILTIDELKK